MTDDSDDIPAGWYPDSEGTIRWWDGGQWTEHVQQSSGDAAPTVVMPADRSSAAEHRARPADDEPDHQRRAWLAATVVGLLAFFLGLGIGSGGSPEPQVDVGNETASSGATVQELDQRERELEQREEALTSKESELDQREKDVEQRERDLEQAEADTGTDLMTNGVFEVGTDVQPGQYVTEGPDDPTSPCSYRVSSDESGGNIFTEEDADGEAEVVLETGQFFRSENCLPWELQ